MLVTESVVVVNEMMAINKTYILLRDGTDRSSTVWLETHLGIQDGSVCEAPACDGVRNPIPSSSQSDIPMYLWREPGISCSAAIHIVLWN